MSKYYINQKFSFRDRFTIKDENLEDIFVAEGEFFSFLKKITLQTMTGEDLLLIREKMSLLMAKFDFYIEEQLVCEMQQKFTWFKKHYEIITPPWRIEGDIWAHDYQVMDGNKTIAKISKKWFTIMDAYEIEVFEEDYLELLLGIVIAIDINLQKDAAAASSST